ncbi:hypothetical protein ACFU6R_14985 [Streptomyces sp. NPDC057499]|uniref:hypothetical protein n=1 Tax=Streptomyces sp. NPDC057499 TaxID=3346150 RepID=UPI0036CA213F
MTYLMGRLMPDELWVLFRRVVPLIHRNAQPAEGGGCIRAPGRLGEASIPRSGSAATAGSSNLDECEMPGPAVAGD